MINRSVFLFLWLLASSCQLQVLSVEKNTEGVWVKEDGKRVLFYQAKTKSKDGQYPRANYIHPLYGPGGFELTEDFPEDHLHHRDIFWAWHQFIPAESQWLFLTK